MSCFGDFWKNMSGAIVSDWVVIGSSIVGLGAAAVFMMSSGSEDLASDVQRSLTQTSVSAPDLDFNTSDTPRTALEGIQYASYFGASAGDGTLISQATADDVITDMNALSTADLHQQYANGAMLNKPTALQAMSFDVVSDLLIERGNTPPWEDAPLYNLNPTSLTADDFKNLWDGDRAVTTRTAVVSALTKYDSLHDLHLPGAYESIQVDWEAIIVKTLMEERGLVGSETRN
ncbi:MAG: hypothetical protein AAF386_02095 [Pseudomonadota bacterium]